MKKGGLLVYGILKTSKPGCKIKKWMECCGCFKKKKEKGSRDVYRPASL
jgi:hypothetical protein